MRLNITIIISIIFAVGLVAIGFTFFQIDSERDKLRVELEERTARFAEIFYDSKLIEIKQLNQSRLESFADSINKRYGLLGILIYYNPDSLLALGSNAMQYLGYSNDYISIALAADTTISNYFQTEKREIFQYIKPFSNATIANSAIVFYSDSSYINNIIRSIWFRNFIRWFMQTLLVSMVTLVIIRLGIFNPINKIVDWVKAARVGNIEKLNKIPPTKFLEPLYKEVMQIARAMHDAKSSAEEEARLRSIGESVWTADRLKVEVENLIGGKKLIVVSNREPYMHIHEGKEIKCIVPASGMITAMEPILKACGGLWIASGSGDADRETVDKKDQIQVPPDAPKYTLRRLWLTKEEEDHYYYGFSNEGLWPLCHIAHTRPVFRKEDWEYYKKVNQYFANAVLEETTGEDDPLILIQDYHFALLPELIKKAKPNAKVAIFWHIPWPNPESFGICPWQKDILLGMLGADLIGFHTQYHCNHFLETVNYSLESRVTWDNFSVNIKGHATLVKPFPISIDITTKEIESNFSPTKAEQLLSEQGITAQYIGIGVDRIDYTKGIVEKFLAVERFLEKNPEYVGKFTFVQIGAPSRTLLKSYADTVNSVENESNRINWRYKTKNWKPILLLKRHHSHQEINPYYSSANICMVTSLHDGMNLVAKEYIATRTNNYGVLILSRFAGAANELKGAIIVNPYDIEKSADAIKFALEMSPDEQYNRMKKMRQSVIANNIYGWAASLIKTMTKV
ncbi:MAG: trehalose-6-phosphate synthase [Saprospiraceae bacterium]